MIRRVQLNSNNHNKLLNVLYDESTYSAIGEEGVTLLYQNSFYHGRISDTQHGLTAIKNAKNENDNT